MTPHAQNEYPWISVPVFTYPDPTLFLADSNMATLTPITLLITLPGLDKTNSATRYVFIVLMP